MGNPDEDEQVANVYGSGPGYALGIGTLDVRRMTVKVCLVGEAAVGKTRLIQRFALDVYDDRYLQTLGTKVYKKEVTLAPSGGRGPVRVDLMVWDIMGQKGFRELLKDAYFYGAHGILAVCDVTRRATLEDLRGWIEGVHEVTGPLPMTLLANKWDLAEKADVDEGEVARAAEAYGAPSFLTSAKTGANVEPAFRDLAGRIAEDRLARGGEAR